MIRNEAMSLKSLLAHQLGRPSGFLGRLFVGRMLDRVNGRVNQLALDALALAPGDALLDIGFGGGVLMREALRRPGVAFVAGIDISEPMLGRARRRFRADIAAGRVDVQRADVSHIPFPAARFDKAAAINTIHFWPDPVAGLREVRRVLKPGGALVLAVRPKEFLERVAFTDHGFTAFDDGELRRLLTTAGFEAVRIEHHEDRDIGAVHVVGHVPSASAG